MWTLCSPMRTLSPDLRLRFKGNRAWPGLPVRAQSPGVLGTPRSLPHGCLEGACQGGLPGAWEAHGHLWPKLLPGRRRPGHALQGTGQLC